MSALIFSRHLFAPAYTETCYTASGDPQTSTLKSEVSHIDPCPSVAVPAGWEFICGPFSEGLASPDRGLGPKQRRTLLSHSRTLSFASKNGKAERGRMFEDNLIEICVNHYKVHMLLGLC